MSGTEPAPTDPTLVVGLTAGACTGKTAGVHALAARLGAAAARRATPEPPADDGTENADADDEEVGR